jgi:cytochrome c553
MGTIAIRATLAATLSLALAGCNAPRTEPEPRQDVAGYVHLCSSCHGITGRSVSPDFPNLAGQQAEYLEAQLHAFRDHTRADPHAHTYMWGMASHLDDSAIASLAAYFSSQPPKPGTPIDEKTAAEARTIFTEGIEARGVPACTACHGENAEGQGTVPRLAGQHREYLADQLRLFRSNARANETMHQNALNLTEPEIEALAAYLSSL